ncbi:serine/threonine-protein kinase [Acanthopleuribacter pedis]|uniref:Serine/threonine protein kinase n=1 Tax=Acanthopleuribacter pedis TaxID=442870 RepID=A0A8J7U4U1_9BACT|nr:serine/threonine-protein kinase [Acanthopleuribacter pedis]MBO1321813.1 serine/threonine protein kinase [Acanthopleuribacter pedis]
MDIQRERHIQNLVKAVIALPHAEREAYLVPLAEQDPDLSHEVKARVEASDAVIENLTLLSDAGTLSGVRIGPYQLHRMLGEGGMGDVYLANREHEFSMWVAIKFLKKGLDRGDVVERFQRERQILADLNHPNIAAILDGGTSDGGRPYFVMEYVEGIPVDAYCRENQLELEQRLRLFRKICSAVSFAHENNVLHRDLKPANILVNAHGEPKLLDFGIAGWLARDPNRDRGDFTSRGMTLDYASPEQVEGKPLTPASDVFSLGVILFQLLTDSKPFDLRDVPLIEAIRRVCDLDPPRPSIQVARLKEDPTLSIDSTEDKEPANEPLPTRWQKRLQGDLDTIVLKALNKQPQDRFATVQALHDEIGRFLVDLPLQSRPRSLLYDAKKFTRRHRAAVMVSGALLSLVFALMFTLVQQQHQLRLERDRARLERDHAQHEQERALAATDFLKDLFKGADPRVTGGHKLTAADLLKKGVGDIQNRFQDQPVLRAELLETLAEVHLSLGLYETVENLLQEARAIQAVQGSPLDLARLEYQMAKCALAQAKFHGAKTLIAQSNAARAEHLAAPHPDRAAGVLLHARILRELGMFQEAEPLYQAALDEIEAFRRLPADEAETRAAALQHASMINHTTDFLLARGHYQRAGALQTQALTTFETYLKPREPERAQAMIQLALIQSAEGRFEEAEAQFRTVEQQRREWFGIDHPLTLEARELLAVLYQEWGRFQVAGDIHKAVLMHRKQRFQADHPAIWNSRKHLALLAQRNGDYKTAAAEMALVLAAERRNFGLIHPTVAETLNLIGILEFERGRYEAAEQHYRKSIEMKLHFFGENHPTTASSLDNLGVLYQELDQWEQAESLHVRALEMRRRLLGDNDIDVAYSHDNLGLVNKNRGRYAVAEDHFRDAMTLFATIVGEDHPDYLSTVHNLAVTLIDQLKYEEAVPLLRTVVALERKIYQSHPTVAISMNNLASALIDTRRYHEAGILLEEASAINARHLDPNHPGVGQTRLIQARYFLKMQKTVEAEDHARRALAICRQHYQAGHQMTARAQKVLGQALLDQGRYAEAEPLLVQAEDILNRVADYHHHEKRELWLLLVRLYQKTGDQTRLEKYQAKLN